MIILIISGYQRTSIPIGYEGELNGIRIREIHMEEDPGQYKLWQRNSWLQQIRIPLIEIVTEPDIKSPEEARNLKELIRVLQYSKGARGEGTMRVDECFHKRRKQSRNEKHQLH